MIPPLESAPFSVYGLDASYPGSRWLNVWNLLGNEGPLWTVTLGHGEAGTPSEIGVVTDAKLPGIPMPYGQIGPTSLDDARRHACLEMILMGTPLSQRDSSTFRDSVDRAVGTELGFDTTDATAMINGAPTTMSMCSYRSAWAAFADLGDVAVAIYGRQSEPGRLSLVPVNDRLGDYRQPPPS